MDPEIKALKTVHRALMSVDTAARKRILDWAWSVLLSGVKSGTQKVGR